MLEWTNIASAFGQVAAAVGTVGTLIYMIRDSKKTSRAVLQQSRLIGSGLRLVSMSIKQDDISKAQKELEGLINEIESENNPK